MRVLNIHERALSAQPAEVGKLIDSLASDEDLLWPRHSWPPMKLDRPLSVGAAGGHGPIRYCVEAYSPGQSIRFRFVGPKGFDGFHRYDVVATPDGKVALRHAVEMNARRLAQVTWPLAFRPMHDALMEDSLACAEASLGLEPTVRRWSARVRLLRWVMSGGKAHGQLVPQKRSRPGS